MKKMRFIGLTMGDYNNTLSRSGVNYNIFKRLSRMSDRYIVFDTDIGKLKKAILAGLYFSRDRKIWRNRVHQNPMAFAWRTKRADKFLRNVWKNYNFIFQDSAMFMPGYKDKLPFFSYHDSNVVLSSKFKPFSQGSHYQGNILRTTFLQEKEVYQRATSIFTMSNWCKCSMIRDFDIPEDKVITVYAGANQTPGDFKKEYDGRTILFIGRNFQRKGGPVLIEAFTRVRREIPDAKLVIIGPPDKFCEKGIECPGMVTQKDKLDKYFKDACIFAMPSYYEPFGIVFAEAFAYKIPCIGTNVCAMPEIIENEKGGYVVPPGNSKALAKRLIEILKNDGLAKSMGEFGFSKYIQHFNWDVVLDKISSHAQRQI
jgi:glycosyltransferase involved in cell wall biosynthesis